MTAKPRTLSVADLRKAGACTEALELAAKLYGRAHVPVTIETVTPLAVYVHWAVSNLLSVAALEQYREATALASEQYREATALAYEQYRKATAPALKQYREATALAREQYREATALALKQYRKATALADEQYDKATDPAREQYDAVCVAAFVTAFNSDTTEH